jgi:hypothetical protein
VVLYQICVFGADLKSNMAARVHNVFSLAEILKIFLSETTKPMGFTYPIPDRWRMCTISYSIQRWRTAPISCGHHSNNTAPSIGTISG